ncbi:SRPBCC family protein [Mucilaginibacter corticis]|uniref:SRPBCC family protein n=1 Tax=Mucilaginibacter corticis TaxID=2597670 RepID=A0A556MGW9_9SPHI|nr:SRPBCC family protein [Mucilaginibacter corticis]TSJ39161.1 SRPBCC family protein [Mucilaginibacter corticis]
MTTFESKKVINASPEAVYGFLSDFNNHGQLMPDSVQNWSASYNEAGFTVQNTIKLSLRITERVENKAVNITAVDNPPFPVQLNWVLEADSDKTNVTFSITAELNMMMKLVASGPLQKLADHETESLESLMRIS